MNDVLCIDSPPSRAIEFADPAGDAEDDRSMIQANTW
jgi:hypothetical protein